MTREDFDGRLAAMALEARQDAGVSQTEMARRSGLSQGRVSDLENGARWSVWHAYLWCQALGLDLSKFVQGSIANAELEEVPGERALLAVYRAAGPKDAIRFLLSQLD